jgi:hypothetical protein
MKKPIISVLLIGGVILASANSVSAGDYTTHYDNKQEAVDWNAKKLEAQMKSTQMRKEKYEMYKAK